jgi:hypothetical protein
MSSQPESSEAWKKVYEHEDDRTEFFKEWEEHATHLHPVVWAFLQVGELEVWWMVCRKN